MAEYDRCHRAVLSQGGQWPTALSAGDHAAYKSFSQARYLGALPAADRGQPVRGGFCWLHGCPETDQNILNIKGVMRIRTELCCLKNRGDFGGVGEGLIEKIIAKY